MEKSKIIYHIAFQEDWKKAQEQGVYTLESVEKEGFIHASLENQVLNSANLFFKNKTDLLLLAIDSEKVKVEVKYENTMGGEELFPHIYGDLTLDAILEAKELKKDEKGNFQFIAFQNS